jgi:hypothetical protein
MPERFHYSKPVHRLGEITALPDEGVILFTVKILINSKNKIIIILNFYFRQRILRIGI